MILNTVCCAEEIQGNTKLTTYTISKAYTTYKKLLKIKRFEALSTF